MSVRLGKTLYDGCMAYCAGLGPSVSRSQAVQYLLVRYLEKPQIYSELRVRVLREPMPFALSLVLPEKLHRQVTEFAGAQQVKISDVFRMAMYQELIVNGNR